MKTTDTLISKEPQEWSPADMERILEMFNSFEVDRMMHIYALHGYYQVLADMRNLGYESDTVQRVVRLLHEYLISHTNDADIDGIIAPQLFAKNTASFFLGGDITLLHERNYGEEGCRFIAQAIAHYGGYNIDDL